MSRGLIDEQVALWAARLVAPTRSTDAAEVARLRADVTSDLPSIDAAARRWTGLGADLPATDARVVGRIGWVQANLAGLQDAFDPLLARVRTGRLVVSRVVGAQIGALLGLLSTKVLGQYVLPLGGPGTGQLVIVGPNLLDLGDEFGPLAADIRRTVVLHEVTHRLQFEGVDWLGDHLRSLLARYLEHARIDPMAVLDIAGRLPEAVAEARREGSIEPVVEALLTPEQLAVVDEAQSMMSLLEGHGNAAMTLAADGVVDDPQRVRDALESRGGDVTTRILSAVAGLEMKKRQYREGEAFVRAVVERAGVPALNRAFDRPVNLPTPDEVVDPPAWLARVTA